MDRDRLLRGARAPHRGRKHPRDEERGRRAHAESLTPVADGRRSGRGRSAIEPRAGLCYALPMRLILALFLGSIACTPSPDSLCEHITRVVERQFGPDDPNDPRASHDRGVARCTEIWSAKKKDDPKAYQCYAKCAVDVKSIVDLASCKPHCYPNEPPPRDETENLEGVIAFPDAASSASDSAP
jgi:hypothetical protein